MTTTCSYQKKVYRIRYPDWLDKDVMLPVGNNSIGVFEFLSEKNARNYIKDKNLKNAVIDEVIISTTESIRTL